MITHIVKFLLYFLKKELIKKTATIKNLINLTINNLFLIIIKVSLFFYKLGIENKKKILINFSFSLSLIVKSSSLFYKTHFFKKKNASEF